MNALIATLAVVVPNHSPAEEDLFRNEFLFGGYDFGMVHQVVLDNKPGQLQSQLEAVGSKIHDISFVIEGNPSQLHKLEACAKSGGVGGKNASIVFGDAKGAKWEHIELMSAQITGIGFPPLDHHKRDVLNVTVKLHSETGVVISTSTRRVIVDTDRSAPLHVNDFAFDFAGARASVEGKVDRFIVDRVKNAYKVRWGVAWYDGLGTKQVLQGAPISGDGYHLAYAGIVIGDKTDPAMRLRIQNAVVAPNGDTSAAVKYGQCW